jgi:hypothetical protein
VVAVRCHLVRYRAKHFVVVVTYRVGEDIVERGLFLDVKRVMQCYRIPCWSL